MTDKKKRFTLSTKYQKRIQQFTDMVAAVLLVMFFFMSIGQPTYMAYALLGFFSGFMFILIILTYMLKKLNKKLKRKDYNFHLQLIEKNINVRDIEHFQELKKSFKLEEID